jgi:DNA-binding IclR family transcriptional regulator
VKTNQHQTLLLVNKQRGVHPRDVVQNFGYSPGTARSYLSYLRKQGLLERMGAGYLLTERGQDRLQYFDVAGCANPACPLCQGKTGYLTCPRCGYQMPKQDAEIRKQRDFFLAVRRSIS